jgi:hypothetical protein
MEIVLSAVLGFMTGAVMCAKFMRHEISAVVEPRLKHIEQQLQNLREETNLDAATRLATLSNLLEDRRRHE